MAVQELAVRQIGRGMSYPFRLEAGGVPWNLPDGVATEAEIRDAVMRAIWFVVKTPVGSMFTERAFGTTSENLLFSPSNSAVADQFVNATVQTLRAYISYLSTVEATSVLTDNELEITFFYALRHSTRPREVRVAIPIRG